MKSLVIASFLFVTAGAATASPPPRSIKVSAQASERIVPDRVLWRLVLNARHRDLTFAPGTIEFSSAVTVEFAIE